MSNILLKSVRLNGPLAFTQIRLSSAKPAIKQESRQKMVKNFDRLTKIHQREVRKKPQRPPFAKNLFLGVFDTELLAYPEVLNKEELGRLNEFLDQVVRSSKEEFAVASRHLGYFGVRGPQLTGGKEFNVTEMCRYAEVVAGIDNSDVGLLRSEMLGAEVLHRMGSDAQKEKYLEAITSGDVTTGFCLAERKTTDFRKMQTTAVESGEFWIINGEKSWVVNGGQANLYVVFAQTEGFNTAGLKESKLTAFFVERGFGGVSTKSTKMTGLQNTDISTVTFRDTKVPSENIIGFVNKGEDVLGKILTNYRLSSGSECAVIGTELLNKFITYCKQESDEMTNLMEIDIVHEKIAEIATSVYAIESVTFMTAGLLDKYEDQDCDLEAAIVKAFSAEHTMDACQKCMNFIGSPAYSEDHWCNELHRNAVSYAILDEPLDTLKIIIALQGLQYAGIQLQDHINMIRNPMFHAVQALSRIFTNRRQINDNPRLTLSLKDHLHPSLSFTASRLEYCVLRLQFVTEQLLARHGVDVTLKHMDIKRLANCVLDIYAMTAVLARASRSYCIGVRDSEHEIMLANAFCLYAAERVKENARKLFVGPMNTNDQNYINIGTQLFTKGKYFPEHPLTKNF